MIAVAGTNRATSGMQLPSLLAGLVIMFGGTAYPLVMSNSSGRAEHTLASFLFWSMSAGFVRGFGFIPNSRIPRLLLSGWACLIALTSAAVVGLAH